MGWGPFEEAAFPLLSASMSVVKDRKRLVFGRVSLETKWRPAASFNPDP